MYVISVYVTTWLGGRDWSWHNEKLCWPLFRLLRKYLASNYAEHQAKWIYDDIYSISVSRGIYVLRTTHSISGIRMCLVECHHTTLILILLRCIEVKLIFIFQPDGKLSTDLILNEFIGSGEDRIKNRDSFTEFFGDIFFTIPAIMLSNAHRG